MAKKGKHKFERGCFNCKYTALGCKEQFTVVICDKFKFDATAKSL